MGIWIFFLPFSYSLRTQRLFVSNCTQVHYFYLRITHLDPVGVGVWPDPCLKWRLPLVAPKGSTIKQLESQNNLVLNSYVNLPVRSS